MLHKIFIDNYKCLVNFDIQLEKIALFLGANGSGKSSVFDAVSAIQRFIGGDSRLADLFPDETLTLWQKSNVQRFGLTVDCFFMESMF